MNNDSKDITKNSKMLEEFLQALAAGKVVQRGKNIIDPFLLEEGEPFQYGGASSEKITFDIEQRRRVLEAYEEKVRVYVESVEKIFSKHADYNSALNQIREVSTKLFACNEKINVLQKKDVQNFSLSEMKKLEELYNERIRLNNQYIDYQQGLIKFVHIDENGLGTAVNGINVVENYISAKERAEYDLRVVARNDFIKNEPFFKVSSDAEEISLKDKEVKVVSGKLTRFTKKMFDKVTGKFTSDKNGILTKITGFFDKFTDEKKLKNNVHAFMCDMRANDMLMQMIKKIYNLEESKEKELYKSANSPALGFVAINPYDFYKEHRLSFDDIEYMLNEYLEVAKSGTATSEPLSPEIVKRLEEKCDSCLEEIKEDMEKKGLSTLQALNNTIHFSNDDYIKKQNLLENYKKASNKLYEKELNDFMKSIRGIELSELKDESASYDVMNLTEPKKEVEVQSTEPAKENTDNSVPTSELINMESSDVNIPNTEPINNNIIDDSSQPANTDLDNENEQNAELAKNEDAHSDEPVFVTATKNYITALENERIQLLQEYDERKKDLRAALERASAKKIKYGDRVPEMNEDPVVVAIQNEVNEIGKRMEKIADDIEHEETKIEELKNKHFLSKAKLNEKSMVIDDYNNVIEGLENDLKTHSTNHQNYFEPDKASNNSGRTSEFGPIEDTIDEDLANDRELNEYRSNLNTLQEEMDALKSDDITDILNHFEDMENAINNNANLSNEDKAEARKQLWENFAEYTATTDENSYKPKSR